MTGKSKIKARATAAQIDAIKPSLKRTLISDELVPNLYLRIEPGGAKAWLYNAAPIRGKGRRIKENLGRWPIVSISEARKEATAHNLTRMAGIDPRIAKAETDAALTNTVDIVFDRWIEYKRRAQEAPRTLHTYQQLYNRNVKPFYGETLIKDFDKAAVRSCITAMHERRVITTANRLLTVTKSFLRWCIDQDYFQSHGALSLLKSNRRAGPGARAFSVGELALCWRGAAQLASHKRDAIRLLVLTGLRRSEVLDAHASDYDHGIWTITRDKMKGKREHSMPLGRLGRELVERRIKFREEMLFFDYLHKTTFHKTIKKLHGIMEHLSGKTLSPWSCNSIRKGVRTALSSDEMDRLGYVFSENISEIVLAHSLGSLNHRYNKAKYASQIGRALSAWEHVLKIEIDRQEREWKRRLKTVGNPCELQDRNELDCSHEHQGGKCEARSVRLQKRPHHAGCSSPSVHDSSP